MAAKLRVYHLLPERWGLAAIRNQRLKVARFDDLNDPFELFAVNLSDGADRTGVRRWKAELNRRFGLLCFSESWASPLLWSHYAEKHRGICLGFDVSEDAALRVKYVATRLDRVGDDLDEDAVLEYLSTKSDEWAYERERRVITDLVEQDKADGNFYVPFSPELVLRELVVGSLGTLSKERLSSELAGGGLSGSGITMHKARLAFNSFAIVKDQRGLR